MLNTGMESWLCCFIWCDFVNTSGGSREGNTGGITGSEQASLFGIPASAYAINAFNLSLSL